MVIQQQSAEVKSGGSQLEILLDGILAATTKTAANTDALTPTLDRIANAIGKQKGGLA